jgi:hypothetical protein
MTQPNTVEDGHIKMKLSLANMQAKALSMDSRFAMRSNYSQQSTITLKQLLKSLSAIQKAVAFMPNLSGCRSADARRPLRLCDLVTDRMTPIQYDDPMLARFLREIGVSSTEGLLVEDVRQVWSRAKDNQTLVGQWSPARASLADDILALAMAGTNFEHLDCFFKYLAGADLREVIFENLRYLSVNPDDDFDFEGALHHATISQRQYDQYDEDDFSFFYDRQIRAVGTSFASVAKLLCEAVEGVVDQSALSGRLGVDELYQAVICKGGEQLASFDIQDPEWRRVQGGSSASNSVLMINKPAIITVSAETQNSVWGDAYLKAIAG